MDQLYNLLGWEELPGARDELEDLRTGTRFQVSGVREENIKAETLVIVICDLEFLFLSLHSANTCVDYPTAFSANSQTKYLLTVRNNR
jgi:hypothetical protein